MVSTYEDAALPRARACNDADLAHVYPGRLLPEEPPRLIVAHGTEHAAVEVAVPAPCTKAYT